MLFGIGNGVGYVLKSQLDGLPCVFLCDPMHAWIKVAFGWDAKVQLPHFFAKACRLHGRFCGS